MRQRVISISYVGKLQTVCSVFPEYKTQGVACRGRKLEKVAKLFHKDFSAYSFLVLWVSSLLPEWCCKAVHQFCIGIMWGSCENADSDSATQVLLLKTVPGPTASVSPGSMSEIWTLRFQPRHAESESAFSEDLHMIPMQNWSLSCTALQHHLWSGRT